MGNARIDWCIYSFKSQVKAHALQAPAPGSDMEAQAAQSYPVLLIYYVISLYK
jgi:hypothetical protein